jgi:hypothetical protein
MPLELGLDLGARYFGPGEFQTNKCLILDSEPYRYQKFISDIAGQDPTSHNGKPEMAIKKISEWLRTDSNGRKVPGGSTITSRYKRFVKLLPAYCKQIHVTPDELSFIEFTKIVYAWLRQNPLPVGTARSGKRTGRRGRG